MESVSKDDFGDRMKVYEMAEAGRRFMPLLPILARVDGRAFHSFTRGMHKPFDIEFADAMIATAAGLAVQTNATVAYTQSDEITLAWVQREFASEIFFGGRIQKIVSQLGAWATLYFYREMEHVGAVRLPTFDARAWQVPNLTEAANAFLWREQDATKNSVSMAARALYSHNQLMGKSSPQMHDMLHARGVNWNDYRDHFKRGTYIVRRTVLRPFTTEEIDKLPPKHAARANPDLMIERATLGEAYFPPLGQIRNRVEVLFEGADPEKADHNGDHSQGNAGESRG